MGTTATGLHLLCLPRSVAPRLWLDELLMGETLEAVAIVLW